MKIDKKKAIYDEAKFLSNLVFYEDAEFSKVKSKDEFVCDECDLQGVKCESQGVVYIDNSVAFCSRKKKINTYNSALIPARYSKCRNLRLDNGNWVLRGEKSIQNALDYSVKYLKNYPDILPPFFVGAPGLGKTHLSISIITELIFAFNKNCLFKQFRDLLSDIKDIYVKGESEKEYVDVLCSYDVLVIDDLGATRMSEWEVSVLDNLIAKRYNSKKHTLFNSNLAFLNGKKFKASESSQILDYKIGKRNISRIFEMCQVMELIGDDFRISIKKELKG